jgi:predicted lipid-binding transport protein (Tim44 family)/DNA-directed RNA polymerase subunit RPC12/RpoP
MLFIAAACMNASSFAAGSLNNNVHAKGTYNLLHPAIGIITGMPFLVNVIFIVLVASGFIILVYLTVIKIQQRSVFNRFPSGNGIKKVSGYDRFLSVNPDFSENEFLGKVKNAFLNVQKARRKQDFSEVRKFISDSVYRLFNTQSVMMHLLHHENVTCDLEVKNLYIDRVDTDGHYDIIHVAVHVSCEEKFSGGPESFPDTGSGCEYVEYWSFIKNREMPLNDIYCSYNCPGCGAPIIVDTDESLNCASCGAVINSGEYDWVLASVAKPCDYIATDRKLRKSAELNEKLRDILNEHDDFSIQKLEDRAADGYLQIITSMALNDPSVMRRFVNDAVFEKITSRMDRGVSVFSGVWLNDVIVAGLSEDRTLNILAVYIKSSCQRFILEKGIVSQVDPVILSDDSVILMSRDKNPSRPKGSLYAYRCPACGTAVKNSLEVRCPHCKAPLNSTRYEWIITDLMTLSEYHDYMNRNAADYNYRLNMELIDKLYDNRDFAFNNIMVIKASDGMLTEQQKIYARELAVKGKYNLKKIEPFLNMAANGRLVIKMPSDPDRRQDIYELMKEAAVTGSNITPGEQQLLDHIRQEYNIS